MKFDVIITTYNRPVSVNNLVYTILICEPGPDLVIVVDSSDIENSTLQKKEKVKYIHSSHKNQPYQRYMGFLASKGKVLVFLDDDMEIVEKDFVSKIEKLFDNNQITGVAIKFINKNDETSLSIMPTSSLFHQNSKFKGIKGWLTGYPRLKPGKFGLCGNRGPQPIGGGDTEWISGGAFATRRSSLFQNFNFQLFDIFEKGLGMGEDGIIGYGLAKQGKLIYHDELFFLHNDQKDSTYTTDTRAFAERVAFSRLYLSLEWARLNHKRTCLVHVHYHYFMLWRIIGLFINLLFNPSIIRWKIIKGTFSGWAMTLAYKFSVSDERSRYWHSEAARDILSLFPITVENGYKS